MRLLWVAAWCHCTICSLRGTGIEWGSASYRRWGVEVLSFIQALRCWASYRRWGVHSLTVMVLSEVQLHTGVEVLRRWGVELHTGVEVLRCWGVEVLSFIQALRCSFVNRDGIEWGSASYRRWGVEALRYWASYRRWGVELHTGVEVLRCWGVHSLTVGCSFVNREVFIR